MTSREVAPCLSRYPARHPPGWRDPRSTRASMTRNPMTVSLSSLGWDDHFASAYPLFDRPDHVPGRVVRTDRGICTVLTATGTARASLGGPAMIAAAADPVALPCAG